MQKILRIFSKIPEDAKTVLFIGTIKNCLGNIDDIFNIADELIAIKRHCIDNNHKINFVLIPEDIDNNDIETIRKILKKIVEKFCRTSDGGINKAMVKKLDKNICIKLYNQDYDINNIFKAIMNSFKNIEYDFIIQNPPYSGSLHLEFLKKGLDFLKKDSGKMTIIEPATWLINIRKNGKAKLYDEIKAKLKGHVSKVIVENYNIEFRTGLSVPFSVTYIDFSKDYENIEFKCFGETRIVNSLYDCNLIGDYNIIWSILNKVLTYGDMMEDHVYDKKTQKEDMWYCKYAEITGGICTISDFRNGHNYASDSLYIKHNDDEFMYQYLTISFADKFNYVSDSPLKSVKRGSTIGALSDKIADCLIDTKEHLENWKHFVFNNKLPLFINMCLTIDQNNNSKPFLPWLVDKHYTDDDINKMFGFTEEEVTFIDKTLKKYERHSPWFRRYMCGKDSVSSEEVQKFIDNL